MVSGVWVSASVEAAGEVPVNSNDSPVILFIEYPKSVFVPFGADMSASVLPTAGKVWWEQHKNTY